MDDPYKDGYAKFAESVEMINLYTCEYSEFA